MTRASPARPVLVIDAGVGNLGNLGRALAHVGAAVAVGSDARAVERAERLVLPGVGAFGAGMKGLGQAGLAALLRRHVESGRALLGICLGYQLLFEESDEFGPVRGLGLLAGRVRRFPAGSGFKVPHMGWNEVDVSAAAGHPLWHGLPVRFHAYFVHSYFPDGVPGGCILGETTYALAPFASAAGLGRLVGTQFHPEKSYPYGLQILENFVNRV